MRFLKQLQLQGYKTFATRTEFLFDQGVTAIVGPNGSGKSNIADALRWVLGEQSYGSLRGKRTEDMIFSGSEQRARLGMAHVLLTLDNSTGWLPIEFSEVEIARRAYRSGENEYFLNGNKVRLRDISELLGNSGLSERTYTVIGQGLIDQALSQRPEERRRLFEEAAGITVHQSKREQAEHQLAEARTNLTRAQDIVGELTPRLRYLKGQARRAQEYQQIRADLTAQLRIWYGYRWRQELAELAAARGRLEETTRAAATQTQDLNTLLEQMTTQRNERASLRDQLSEWHRTSSQLHRQAETAQRELAVRTEQARLLGEQGEELQRDLVRLRAAQEDAVERLQGVTAELAEAAAAHEAHAAQVAAAQRDVDERERARRAQVQRLTDAQEAVLAARARLADGEARLAQMGERRAELERARTDQSEAATKVAAQAAELESQVAAANARLAQNNQQSAKLEQERQAQGRDLAAAQEAERAAREQLGSAQRALARLQDQLDMLSRLRDEGAGLSNGPRNVMAAARRAPAPNPSRGAGQGPERPGRGHFEGLSGIVGTLGELIEVPAELERAIEAALGGRLQDIVVEGWQDAEAAVTFLKQTQGGRATFLPLDSLRPGRAIEAPRMPGVLGIASDLVKFDATIRPAVEVALNHIVVVQDLQTARRALGKDSRATLVTIDGEIVRPSGSVTGGAEGNRRDSGLLSRARALRELPDQIRSAAALVTQREAAVAEARKAQEAAQAAIATLRGQQRDLASQAERLTAEKNRLQLALERARQTGNWHAERRQQAEKELGQLASRETELQTEAATLADQLAQKEAGVEAARRELAQLATDDVVSTLARLRAETEVKAAQRKSLEASVDDLHRSQAQRTSEMTAKEQRIQALAAQQAEATEAIDEHGGIAGTLADQIAQLAAQIDPAEARLAQVEHELRAGEAQERALREGLRSGQMRQSQAELALQRAQDRLTHLREEIDKELGLATLEDVEAGAEAEPIEDDQPPLPLNGLIVHLPAVAELPEGLERAVHDLRGQISRLGPVNLEALNEYNEVEARYNFLTGQAADLQTAVGSLEEVIAELNRVMDREFTSTFKAVAAQFKEEFVHLFGGGSAKLVLTEPECPSTTGVEIIARPPGKREQGLSLLSGGERTLTAAALIFSILKVRPTPFCVLDEVDAALDEANVGRFRDALKALSSQTQFLMITHNRGTVEAADTIYGITMGTDNTSQVLSLKLQGQEIVREDAVQEEPAPEVASES